MSVNQSVRFDECFLELMKSRAHIQPMHVDNHHTNVNYHMDCVKLPAPTDHHDRRYKQTMNCVRLPILGVCIIIIIISIILMVYGLSGYPSEKERWTYEHRFHCTSPTL